LPPGASRRSGSISLRRLPEPVPQRGYIYPRWQERQSKSHLATLARRPGNTVRAQGVDADPRFRDARRGPGTARALDLGSLRERPVRVLRPRMGARYLVTTGSARISTMRASSALSRMCSALRRHSAPAEPEFVEPELDEAAIRRPRFKAGDRGADLAPDVQRLYRHDPALLRATEELPGRTSTARPIRCGSLRIYTGGRYNVRHAGSRARYYSVTEQYLVHDYRDEVHSLDVRPLMWRCSG